MRSGDGKIFGVDLIQPTDVALPSSTLRSSTIP